MFMGFDRLRIKSNARLFYKNNTGMSIVMPLIHTLISGAAGVVIYIISVIMGIIGSAAAGNSDGAIFFVLLIYPLIFAFSFAVAPLMWGLMSWFRKTIYVQTPLTEMFAPYGNGRFWSSVGTAALISLYTWLWSLLFVIPGIIKTYSYSQTMFIKTENPNIPASRAIQLSMAMMEGHKWELFILHCSFLGWFLLSGLTYNILGIVYVFPYYYAALAFAYEEIKADAAARGVINIAEIMGDVYPTMPEQPGMGQF